MGSWDCLAKLAKTGLLLVWMLFFSGIFLFISNYSQGKFFFHVDLKQEYHYSFSARRLVTFNIQIWMILISNVHYAQAILYNKKKAQSATFNAVKTKARAKLFSALKWDDSLVGVVGVKIMLRVEQESMWKEIEWGFERISKMKNFRGVWGIMGFWFWCEIIYCINGLRIYFNEV